MFVPFLVLRNAFRHKLRTTLTMVGIVVAIVAFGLLRTIVDAWYAGSEASSSARLITRSSISLVFFLPLNYAQKIRQVDGVKSVSWMNWFGGIYITEANFFPQFAVDAPTFLGMYPEYRLDEAERKAFLLDRGGAVAGRKLADKYGWKVGDRIPLRGTIFPGTWTFTLRAIYDGADNKVDETQFFFHWDYLNETVKARFPRRADLVGLYVVEIRDPAQAAEISQRIDATFRNSLAETLSETEKAFQLGFVAMTEAILIAIEAVSFVIILIIMAVMANTMAMTARERYSEYATLKAIGFSNGFVALLIFAESLGIALAGGAIGIALTFPIADWFAGQMGTLFPVFFVSPDTVAMQVGAALVVGVVAALIPAWRAAHVRIVDGLRAVA
ncbi:MAG: ABC transporter permease [Betaproteobacteria bacterium]|nr:ABC transporter permease [Betaproteobacteria bacterium]MCC7216502.1 ABC transporter permease [Burkholderiales bacterium]